MTTNLLETLHLETLSGPSSRRDALKNLGKLGAGVALASTPFGLFATARPAFAQSGSAPSVTDILNYALTLEYLEATFYNMGVAQSGLIPASDLTLFTAIRDDENAHVDFLKSALGSAAISKPTFDFTAGGMFDPFGDYATFKLLSQAFEDTGVRAYKGQAPNLIGNDTVLKAALQIHSIEARHASMVRQLNGLTGWIPLSQPGVPPAAQPVYAGEEQTTQLGVDVPSVANISAEEASEAFDEPLDMDAVLAIAGPFVGN